MKRATYIKFWERFEETVREIGTLLVALAPLDAALGDLRMNWKGMSFFVIVGITFLSIAFIPEIRRQNDS